VRQVKVGEENRLLGSILQMVTGGISDKFSDAKQREISNYANCRHRRKFLFRSLSILRPTSLCPVGLCSTALRAIL
jgi:hypothetical protein